MNFIVHTRFTDGRTISLKPGETSDGLKYSLTEEDGIYTPRLFSDTTCAVNAIDLQLQTPIDFFDQDLYLIDNHNQTNDIIHLRRYGDVPRVESKDFTVMKNKRTGALFNVGFVTAWRFYTWITIESDKVFLHYEMEDKPLVKGEVYTLERFMADQTPTTDFLERYAAAAAKINNVKLNHDTPVGFCSWSCLYSGVSEKNIKKAADEVEKCLPDNTANLVQIDDGWQANGSFCGVWKTDEKKFPSGITKTAEHIKNKGMKFGLWTAPLIVSTSSEYFTMLKPLLMPEPSLGGAYPLNLAKKETHELLRENFSRLKNEYGAQYFKLDFLACAIHRFTNDTFVRFDGDYAVAYYRKALQTIRQTVGDSHLLACGAPILESAGYLDSIRVSCDIIWGKSPVYPTYWQIIKDVTRSMLHRFFYHNHLFYNDPDGLVVRDYDNGDGFDSTYGEARLWATTVAMSGGAVLINEQLEKVGPARKELFSKLVPALGLAAKPLDYFEYPQPTCAYIDVDEDTKFIALYRWDDNSVGAMEMPTETFGFEKALIVNCWDPSVVTVSDKIKTGVMSAHSAEMYLLRRVPEEPCFAFSDTNVFCGINIYASTFSNNRLTISNKLDKKFNNTLYAYYPDKFEAQGEFFKDVDGGKIMKI